MKYIFIFLLWLAGHAGNAQIGEAVNIPFPIQHLEKLIQKQTKKKSRIGKSLPVIISYWNQSCMSSVNDLMLFDSLQKVFAGKVRFILINPESKDSTRSFFAFHPKIKKPTVTMVSGGGMYWDTTMKYSAPSHAWITADHHLKYLTHSHNLTIKHINSFLAGEQLKIENLWLRIKQSKKTSNKLYISSLTKCGNEKYTGKREGALIDGGRSVLLNNTCQSVVNLFRQAYSEKGKYVFNTVMHVAFEGVNKDSLVMPSPPELRDLWNESHRYSYELILPADKMDQRYKWMQNDLTLFFGLSAKVEKRRVKTYVLYAEGDTSHLRTIGNAPRDNFIASTLRYPVDQPVRQLVNQPFSELSEKLKAWIEYHLSVPFIDKTGIRGNVDLAFRESSIDPFDFEQLKIDLRKYKLFIRQSLEPADVLVISKRE